MRSWIVLVSGSSCKGIPCNSSKRASVSPCVSDKRSCFVHLKAFLYIYATLVKEQRMLDDRKPGPSTLAKPTTSARASQTEGCIANKSPHRPTMPFQEPLAYRRKRSSNNISFSKVFGDTGRSGCETHERTSLAVEPEKPSDCRRCSPSLGAPFQPITTPPPPPSYKKT